MIPGSATRIIGIDPGKKGALALYTRHARITALEDMPLLFDGRIDLFTLARLVGEWITQGTVLLVESAVTVPGRMGAGAGYGVYFREQGQVVGVCAAVAAALGFAAEVREVHPLEWKKFFGLFGQGKKGAADYILDKGLATVADLTPARARKPSDGRSDALLIATYGAVTEGIGCLSSTKPKT